jgi:hypothetical protein
MQLRVFIIHNELLLYPTYRKIMQMIAPRNILDKIQLNEKYKIIIPKAFQHVHLLLYITYLKGINMIIAF